MQVLSRLVGTLQSFLGFGSHEIVSDAVDDEVLLRNSGTGSPTKLVVNEIRVEGGADAGLYLQSSDANGNAQWVAPPGGDDSFPYLIIGTPSENQIMEYNNVTRAIKPNTQAEMPTNDPYIETTSTNPSASYMRVINIGTTDYFLTGIGFKARSSIFNHTFTVRSSDGSEVLAQAFMSPTADVYTYATLDTPVFVEAGTEVRVQTNAGSSSWLLRTPGAGGIIEGDWHLKPPGINTNTLPAIKIQYSESIEQESVKWITQSLNNLDDVNTNGATIGQYLSFDGTQWLPGTAASGGGGTGGGATKTREVGTFIAEETLTSDAEFFPQINIPAGYERIEIELKIKSSQPAAHKIIFNGDTNRQNYVTSRYVGGRVRSSETYDTSLIGVSTSNEWSLGRATIFRPNDTDLTHCGCLAFDYRGGRNDNFPCKYEVTHEVAGAVTSIQIGVDRGVFAASSANLLSGSNIKVFGYRFEEIASENGVVSHSNDDVSNPPTKAELTSSFGDPTTLPDGYTAILDDNGDGTTVYHCAVSNGEWWYTSMTKGM